MDYYDPDEDWSPGRWLGSFTNELWNDYLNYWEVLNVPADSTLTDEDRERNRQLVEIAKSIVPALHSLALAPEGAEKVRNFLRSMGARVVDDQGARVDIDEELAVSIARVLHDMPIVRDGVRCDLAMHATDVLLSGAEGRAAVLVSLLATRRVSPRAAAFLDRATRLYLWGFEPETVVMCAAALEAAYETRFPPEEMFRLQIAKKGTRYEPHEYERAAIAAKVFTPDDRRIAESIRLARNATVHLAPNVALGAVAALKGAVDLLAKLFPAEEDKGKPR